MNIRKIFPLVLFTLALVMTACLDKAESHYTPRLTGSYFIRNSTDTLYIHTDENTGKNIMDTIAVGDTVRFAIGYASLGNNLLTAKATWDEKYSSLCLGLLSDELRTVMLDSSDTLACCINLPIGYNYVGLPFTYIALQAGDPALTFTAVTDSKFSPAELSIVTPIRAKAE